MNAKCGVCVCARACVCVRGVGSFPWALVQGSQMGPCLTFKT